MRAALALAILAVAAGHPALAAGRKADLADTVAGSYAGDVVSHVEGASRRDVALTLARTGENFVTISSSDARLPLITVRLSSALGKIVYRDSATAFAYDGSVTPAKLDVRFSNEVSWAGTRRPD